jgi:sulfur carrier protein
MRVAVNGEQRELAEGALATLLRGLGVDLDRPGIAVAVNGEVVARAAWDATVLRDGDEVEVLTAVQGG